eukprot:3358094-Lingulodinium_polyedra.AAC.1
MEIDWRFSGLPNATRMGGARWSNQSQICWISWGSASPVSGGSVAKRWKQRRRTQLPTKRARATTSNTQRIPIERLARPAAPG